MDSAMLTKLVDETFDESYSPRSANVIEGKYIPSINCFRFVIDNLVIDFPENWEFFNQINSNVLPLERWELASFDTSNDPLKLVQCFGNIASKLAFFIQEERIFLEIDS